MRTIVAGKKHWLVSAALLFSAQLSVTSADASVIFDVTDLGSLGGKGVRGYDINDAGQVTGSSSTMNNASLHAFLYSDGIMVDLGTGNQHSSGYSINNVGQAEVVPVLWTGC